MTWQYWILVVGLITGGGLIFFVMAKVGEKLVTRCRFFGSSFRPEILRRNILSRITIYK
jgi:hypothetical protein